MEEETTEGAIGGEEQVHVITISDFLGALQVLWLGPYIHIFDK